MPVKRTFAAQIEPALLAIDTLAGVQKMIPITIEPLQITRLDQEKRRQKRYRATRRFMHHLGRGRAVKALRTVVRPLMNPVSPLLARISRSRAARRSS
jgi:hypothetical protein